MIPREDATGALSFQKRKTKLPQNSKRQQPGLMPRIPSSHLESTLLPTPSYFLCPEAKSLREPPYQIQSGQSLTEPYAKATYQSSTLVDRPSEYQGLGLGDQLRCIATGPEEMCVPQRRVADARLVSWFSNPPRHLSIHPPSYPSIH